FEAQAIAWAVRGERLTPRPMTHDLLKNIIERLGARVERLTIDDLWQETYYAKISLAVGDKIIDVDTRPSDGIALAMRADAPIYVSEAVLEEANRPQESGGSMEEPFNPPDEE
ncbi:MAG TPA: bifunctional nuclease family protein, partial [Armatimonadota bacterium]|nr:bifunctional nuclease family protein [Armatimonadota bacterium]